MKIVLVNYRYFISGGPERYLFNIKEVLRKEGHEVISFSIKNSRNFSTKYEKYFLNTLDDEVYFAQSKKTVRIVFKSIFRMFYSFEAKRKFKKLLNDTCPDIIYIMQYHSKISPSIIDVAKRMKLPVIHRISDFQYICPNCTFYNNVKGICEDCLNGKYWRCIKYKCVKGSLIYSGIKVLTKLFYEALGIVKKIDAFVVPSLFTLKKLNQYGIPIDKLYHIPTFFNIKDEMQPVIEYKPFLLYIGRIASDKGLLTLIKSIESTDYHLKIIGFSNDGYDEVLKSYLKDIKHNIELLGRMEFKNIVPYLSSCLCTVVPSELYDNFPNAILESFAYKKAVIATNIGSLPELVKNNETGLLFDYASVNSLKEKIEYMFDNKIEAQRMGENAYLNLIQNYSPEKHYLALMNLFNTLTRKKYENI